MANILRSKRFHTVVGILVSVLAMAWAVHDVKWSSFFNELKRINAWWLIPLTVSTWLHYALRAIRWRYLIPDGEKLSFTQAIDPLAVGNFASYILPLRAGEFIRPWYLTRFSDYKFTVAFSSIVIERFFDLSTVLISLAIVSNFIPSVPSLVIRGANVLGIIAILILLFIFAAIFCESLLKTVVGKACSFLHEKLQFLIENILSQILAGISVLRSPKNLAMNIILSIVIWLSCFLNFEMALWAFHIVDPPWIGVTLAVFVALAVAAPSAPGFIGVFQAGAMLALGLFGYSPEISLAYAMLVHTHTYLFVCGWGVLVLLKNNLKFSELASAGVKNV